MEFFAKFLNTLWEGNRFRLFRPADSLVGLDIGTQTITLVQLKLRHGRWQLHFGGMKSLSQHSKEKGGVDVELAREEAIRNLLQEGHIHQPHVACSIGGPSVMVKFIQVPMMKASELEEHLELELDQYIPADESEIYWDYHITEYHLSRWIQGPDVGASGCGEERSGSKTHGTPSTCGFGSNCHGYRSP